MERKDKPNVRDVTNYIVVRNIYLHDRLATRCLCKNIAFFISSTCIMVCGIRGIRLVKREITRRFINGAVRRHDIGAVYC
jgi:hypothetical protein